MGKLIVFEGTDGTGKSTQFALLTKRLQSENIPFRRLQFPQYLEPSSALIRMYLNGEFGDDPNSVNAYAASTFYAVDRYASYQRVWKDDYAGRPHPVGPLYDVQRCPPGRKARWSGAGGILLLAL